MQNEETRRLTFAEMPTLVKVASAFALFGGWVIFEEGIVDRTGLWEHLPGYVKAQFCPWDLMVGGLIFISLLLLPAFVRKAPRRLEAEGAGMLGADKLLAVASELGVDPARERRRRAARLLSRSAISLAGMLVVAAWSELLSEWWVQGLALLWGLSLAGRALRMLLDPRPRLRTPRGGRPIEETVVVQGPDA